MSDLIAQVQNDFIGAWNAHDADRVLANFAEDASVTIDPPFPGAPPVFQGKAQLQGFVGAFIAGIHVDVREYRAEGDSVYFDATVGADATRALGVPTVTQGDRVDVKNGKITAFVIDISPESSAQLNAGAAKMMAAQTGL